MSTLTPSGESLIGLFYATQMHVLLYKFANFQQLTQNDHRSKPSVL